MSAGRRRTPRDARRRSFGQNSLADQRAVRQLIDSIELAPTDPVLEIGPGRGALTLPLAEAGARVRAIERDPVWADRLRQRVGAAGLNAQVEIVAADFRAVRLPVTRYRVIANPSFSLTTALLAHLLDDPSRGPWRTDILVQREVAEKRSKEPPTTLRSAAWSPWWTFDIGVTVPRTAFRPVPKVDAALLTIRRRDADVLPDWLAPRLRELLRPGWHPPAAP